MRTFCVHVAAHTGTGWSVAVCRDRCQGKRAEPVGEIPSPLPPLDAREPQEAAREAMLRSTRAITIDHVGRYLHELLPAAAQAAWSQALESGQPVRTLLQIDDDQLAALPWETLTRTDDVRPFREVAQPAVRVRGIPRDLPSIRLPVRVLVVVGDRRPIADDLRPDDELDAIVRSIARMPGQWHVEVVDQPSAPDLADQIRRVRPHVLHLIAHGGRESGAHQRPGLLVYSSKTGKEWVLTSPFVADMRYHLPRVTVLSACRTTALDEQRRLDDLVVVRALAGAFLQHRCAAVIAMHGDVRSAAAATFSEELYARLVQRQPVDIAVTAARLKLDDRDWMMPSLTVTAGPSAILRPVPSSPLPLWYPDLNKSLGKVTHLVNHGDIRRRVWQALDPDDTAIRAVSDTSEVTGSEPARLILLEGAEAGVGAGGVMRAALLTCLMRGRAVALASLGRRTLRFEDMLRAVRDALAEQVGEVATEPKRRFDHVLAHLVDGRRPPPLTGDVTAVPDVGHPFRPHSEHYDELVRAAFVAFRTMLDEIAAARPLTLGLHRLSAVTSDHRPFVIDHLIRPHLAAASTQVQLVIADTAAQLPELHGLGIPVESVPGFAKADLHRLVREYCARRGDPFDDAWRAQLALTAGRITKERWRPRLLTTMRGLVYPEDDE